MNVKLLITGLLLASVTTSCKKEIYGCMDLSATNYSTLANTDDGSCFYDQPNAKSTIVTISTWIEQSSAWATTIPYGDISTNVIDNGGVLTYINTGTNIWNQLPLTIYNSVDYSTTIEVSITVGQVIVTYKNSDGSLPANPGEKIFKITVID
ncbi:MAG: hypothetical protein IPM74_08085 [Crocinitomicaceae bacterium]|nr:hypothetical protein [Crocinitomicaceae bacterium]